jgi:hypothetical protein
MKIGLYGLFVLICTHLFLHADEGFLTPDEYAKKLYKNPRGISCAKCHGEHGEGKVISSYIEKGELKQIVAPPIVNISQKRFKKALKRRFRLMPEYFLTEVEMAYLYFYLIKQRDKKKR